MFMPIKDYTQKRQEPLDDIFMIMEGLIERQTTREGISMPKAPCMRGNYLISASYKQD